MKTILIINGPNLNRLGQRQTNIYGDTSMEEVLSELRKEFPNLNIKFFQSNHEGALIDRLQERDFNAVVINPGALTHYSYALADALADVDCPKIEVHISNIHAREDHRKTFVTAPHCDALLSGFGTRGYSLALLSLQFSTHS